MAFHSNLSIYESILFGTSALFLVYICFLGIKRVYFDPLSRFPGPKLAALTFWYEFYYDCILGGQYGSKLLDLHKQYNSNVIRINPLELHFLEPDFFSEIYTGSNRRRDIDYWFAAQFGADESLFTTPGHDLHRERRAALAPLFSMGSVRKLQPVIEERVDKLMDRMREFGDRGEVLDLTLAFPALTNDIISEFSFARCDHMLEKADFGAQTAEMLLIGTKRGHLMKHLPMLRKLIEMIPEKVMVKLMPLYGSFASLKNGIAAQIEAIQEQKEKSTWTSTHQTIFSEILDSKLPSHEKTPSRLASEGRVLIQAGTLTTSWTLALAFFYLLSQPEMLKKLRQELAVAIPDPDLSVPLVQLEHLPYLTACIKESLRLGFGASSRLPRIPTDEILVFHDKKSGKEWKIPMGTKCSMTTVHILLDPNIFKSPLSFLPERWIEDEDKRLDRYFVPFAKGNRACLGKNLAYGELYLTLGKLFRRFGGPESEEGEMEGVFRLWETEERDVLMEGDYFIPLPWEGSKGVRVVVDKV